MVFIPTQLKTIDIFNSVLRYLCSHVNKLRLRDKKIGKYGFHKNGAGIGENAYQVRYGSSFRKEMETKDLYTKLSCMNFSLLKLSI